MLHMTENSSTYTASFKQTSVHELIQCLNGENPRKHTLRTPIYIDKWYIFVIVEQKWKNTEAYSGPQK